MSSASIPVEKKSSSAKPVSMIPYLAPYLVLIGAQLPMLFMYYRGLWAQPHYKFFPFAFIAFGLFLTLRWPNQEASKFFSSKFSSFLFAIGVGLGIMGTIFLTPWFTAASVMLLITSLLARTKDGQNPDRSLIAVALPLWVTLTPFGMDQFLITKLQTFSASISSNYLDLLDFKHYLPGTVLEFPNERYGVEQACSGVQSFFTLLFCSAVFIVLARRPWFRGMLLMGLSTIWAIFMNSVRIVLIPMSDILFGINLKDGIAHDLLGYTVLLLAILLVLSTDQFLMFIFGPVDSESMESGHPMRRAISRFWNSVLASTQEERSTRRQKRRNTRPSNAFKMTAWVCAGLFGLMGVMQIIEVQRSLLNPKLKVRFFSSAVILPFDQTDLDPEIVTVVSKQEGTQEISKTYKWKQNRYTLEDRSAGSDLGQRSDRWEYASDSNFMASVSIDQTFPGWHELTTCYKNDGWLMKGRTVKTEIITDADGNEIEWPYVEADFEHKTRGEKAFLVFAFTDGMGIPYVAPVQWGGIQSFIERTKNRLAHQYRKRVFRGEAYQMQIFAKDATGRKLSGDSKDEVREQFMTIRKVFRQKLIEKSLGNEQISKGKTADAGEPNSE